MYLQCEYHEEYCDTNDIEDDCLNHCDFTQCKAHPMHDANEVTARLNRLKSSEFAAEVLKKMSVMFEIPEKDASVKLERMFNEMQNSLDQTLKDLVFDAVRVHLTKQYDAVAKQYVKEVFEKTISAKVIKIDPKGKATDESIHTYALNKITKLIDNENNNGRSRSVESDTVDKAIEALVGKKVEEASSELLNEVRENFSKAAMKKMMEGMVKALGDDKRLLAVMTSS